jgi:hypothetical protein
MERLMSAMMIMTAIKTTEPTGLGVSRVHAA